MAHRRNRQNEGHVAIVGSMGAANRQSLGSMTVLANRMCLNADRTSLTDFGMDCSGVSGFAAINHTNKRLRIFAV